MHYRLGPTILLAVRSPPETIRLTLEIERDTEPVAGRLTAQNGLDERFVGWTGLAAALTLALEGTPSLPPRVGLRLE